MENILFNLIGSEINESLDLSSLSAENKEYFIDIKDNKKKFANGNYVENSKILDRILRIIDRLISAKINCKKMIDNISNYNFVSNKIVDSVYSKILAIRIKNIQDLNSKLPTNDVTYKYLKYKIKYLNLNKKINTINLTNYKR